MKYTVTKIFWDRIRLVFRLEGQTGEPPREGLLLDGQNRLGGLLRTEALPGGVWELRCNVTNGGNDRCPEPGAYRLCLPASEKGGEPVCLQAGAELSLEEAERTFSYGKRGGCMQICPARGEDGALLLRIRRQEEQPERSLKKRLYQRGMRGFLQGLYRISHSLRPRGRQRILLMSEQNASLGDNLLALRRGLENRGMKGQLRESCRVTVTKAHLGLKSWIRTVREMAAADVIVLDDHAPLTDWLVLAEDTRVIQLWHGGVGFKASGYSRWGHAGSLPPFSGHRQITCGICGSEADRELFAEIWGISPSRVIPTGLPRMDALMEAARRRGKETAPENRFPYIDYPQLRTAKCILFAPTYRGENRMDASYPYERIDWKAWYEACGEEYVVLVQMHPWVREAPPIPREYRDRIIDVGRERDRDSGSAEDLLLAADLLITDYSSIIFDFAALQRPMLFYAFDREEYEEKRGIHGTYRDMAPGKVTESFPELLEAIRKGDFEEERAEAYRRRHFDRMDAGSTDRVIDWLLLGELPERFRLEQQEAARTAARIGRPYREGETR